MTLTRVFPIASMAASFAGRSLVLALAVSAQVNAAEVATPTPKEQALMEHACRATQKPGAAHDEYEECLAARLQSLRADFGTDLGKLSAAARGKIDTACNQAHASLGREAYIGCLSGQLAVLSGRARAKTAAAAPLPPQGAIMPSAALIIPPAPPEPSPLSMVSLKSVGIALTTLGVLAGLVVVGMKAKRVKHLCRVCGVLLPGTGDLCAACRHEAAEPLRRAAGERAERQRAEEAEQRQREQADEQRQELMRQEEAERLRLDEQRQQEEAERLRAEEAHQQEAEARRHYDQEPASVLATSGDEDAGAAFDPYRGLGLTSDATHDQVRAAYEAARAKYDPDLVEHLGCDVKDHFAEKFRTIERAYRMIAGTMDETTSATL